MRHHGVMVIGPTAAQAFDDLYYYERACCTYLTALQSGRKLRVVSDRARQGRSASGVTIPT